MSQEFLKISYVKFFNYFKLFLSFDASASLIKGRDRLIILQFYKVFTALNDLSTTDSFEEKKSRFNSEFEILRKRLHSYLENNGNEKINLTCGNLDSKNLQIRVDAITTINLKAFIKANSYYRNFRKNINNEDLKRIYLNNVCEYYNKFFPISGNNDFITLIKNEIESLEVNKNTILKQALMEFFNALSHLLKVVCNNEAASNLNSFNVHLYRGALDYYKAIIKDISFLYELSSEEQIKLKDIREFEYLRIGNTSNRNLTLEKFEDFINLLFSNRNLHF